MPASAWMTSNRPGNFPSRSLIRRCPAAGILQVHHEIPGRLRHPGRRRVGGAPRILILRLACPITASTCSRAPDRVTVSKKSQASRPRPGSAGNRPTWRNCARVPGRSRRRAGSPRRWKRRPSPRAPAGRRAPGDPHPGFSRTSRNTRTRIERTVRRRPGRRGRDRRARRRATTSRCQRSTVSGRTTRCSRLSTSLGSRCSRAASNARSPGVNRTLSGPSCRCRTKSWWRSARISASLSRLLTGSSRSSANTFVTPR